MKELDNIIFDVKPHEVDEAVKLLEAWGYPKSGYLKRIPPQAVEADKDGLFFYNQGNTRTMHKELKEDGVFICTLEELRIVTAELKV